MSCILTLKAGIIVRVISIFACDYDYYVWNEALHEHDLN